MYEINKKSLGNTDEILFNNKIFKKYDDMYYVSEDGDVYSTYAKKVLKPHIDCDGYMRVDIHSKHMKIHKLVFIVWVRPLNDGEQVNHMDDDKTHNHYMNLYAGTQKENIEDKHRNQHNVGNVFYLTIFDKQMNKTITFCPASEFIDYCGHTNKSGSLNKFFNKNWFKKRYDVLEFKRIKNLEQYNLLKGVTTKGDECSPVG